jgi:hypothetical protein
MSAYPSLEDSWIRRIKENNNEIKQKQNDDGLFNYPIGDILLVCVDKNKTKNKFDKKRRNFEYLGSFIDYSEGNVVINLLNKNFVALDTIAVPIYFTKFCGSNIAGIPDNVFNVLGYKKPKINIEENEEKIIE